MTKKLFSTVAAAAVLSTSAMAYDLVVAKDTNLSNAYGMVDSGLTADRNVTTAKAGDALIFPAYFVDNGWQTTLRVINTNTKEAMVAKVVLYAGNDSHEVRDFNIYLSANDEWTGTIMIDSDGNAKVISDDDSAPLVDGTMASAENPMKSEAIDVTTGYVEVIGCASTATNAGAHADHQKLREAYQDLALTQRMEEGVNPIFSNGVIVNGAKAPYMAVADLNGTAKDGTVYTFHQAANDSLIGDVRITDTVNGKDMVMPAVALNDVTVDEQNAALLYLEGEAANIADRDINSTLQYSAQLDLDAAATSSVDAIYMTTGDSANLANNQLLLTSPFKRMLVNKYAGVDDAPLNDLGFQGAKYDEDTKTVSDYGFVALLAQIFDKSENAAAASQFSPATTPTLNFKYEVSASEGNAVQTDNLSYYLNQAGASYEKGYALLSNALTGAPITGIATQMIATDVAGKVVTNWIPAATK